jgi:hypothetical protein
MGNESTKLVALSFTFVSGLCFFVVLKHNSSVLVI